MAKVQDVLDTQKQIEESLLAKMASFEKQLRSTAPGATTNLEKLSQEFTEFKKSVWSIMSLLRSLIDSLTLKVDDLDSQSRRNALLFSGIQETNGENCSAIILEIVNSKMGLVDIQATALQSCHRLGGKSDKRNRPMLVRFADVATRNLVWSEKKKLKSSSTVVGEFLTKSKQEIFIAARKYFGITRCWTQGGQVIIKLPNNERNKVSSLQELDSFIAKFPTPVVTTVTGASAGTVAAHKASKTAVSPAGSAAVLEVQARSIGNRPAATAAKARIAK